MSRIALLVVASISLLASVSRAQVTHELLAINFAKVNEPERFEGSAYGASARELQFRREGPSLMRHRLDDVLWLRRTVDAQPFGRAAIEPPPFLLRLVDGQQLPGRPLGIDGESLSWWLELPPGDPVTLQVPLHLLGSIHIGGESPAARRGELTEDRLTLRNGDIATGILDSIGGTTIRLLDSTGNAADYDLSAVTSIQFASVPAPADSVNAPAGVLVTMNDATGARLRVASVDGPMLPMNEVDLVLDDGQRVRVEADDIESIRTLSGVARFLVDLIPTAQTRVGYFGPAVEASEFDPASRRIPPGSILMPSRTLLHYRVERASRLFTRASVPEGLAFADVTARVLIDGEVAFESVSLTSGDSSPPIEITIRPGQSLTLEADFGQNYGVQDQLLWHSPVLLPAE